MKSNKKIALVVATTLLVSVGFLLTRRTAPLSGTQSQLPIPENKSSNGKISGNATKTSVDPKTTALTPRSFVTMSVLERNALLNGMRKQDLRSIFRAWIDAGRVEHDLMKQGAIATTLSFALREQALGQDFADQLAEFILNPANPSRERSELLGALGRAATKEALDILIQMATKLEDRELRKIAAKSISLVGEMRGDGIFHEELSPALERVWRESTDQDILGYSAVAMAKIGAPAGIDLLLASGSDTGSRDDVKREVAKAALSEVMNPASVPLLSSRLINQPPTAPVALLASSTLATIGDDVAGKALANWLQNADESAADVVKGYVAAARTEEMLSIWQTAVDPAVSFRSEKNREAVRAGLAQRRQNP